MKKLSLAAFMVVNAFCATVTLYQDTNTGAIYTKPGPNRVVLGEFVSKDELKKETLKEIKKELPYKHTLQTHFRVIKKNSPEFLLGKETGPNMLVRPFDNPDMYMKFGVRVMGTFENYKEENKATGVTEEDFWDAYLRRVRFEVTAGFGKHTSFTMDIRNDKANYRDSGEKEFNVGDAYLKIKKPFGTSLANFKLYRGKIDVSRTETVKSAYVIHYDRPHVADEAAQYISHNRRATNIQMYGNWKHKIAYQIAMGDGVYSGKLKDARGKKFSSSTANGFHQDEFFYGGKIVLSPFDGWEEKKRTETYFAQGKHFSIGAAYWKSPDINFVDGNGKAVKLDHTLINYELSAHYKGAFVQAEYFKFDGVVSDWNNAQVGKSNGWYVTGEYVIPSLYYIAPFARYEKWDKLEDANGYDMTSKIAGINWYLRGNSTKVGIAYQEDDYDVNVGDKKVKRVKFTTQWFF
ncbi:MULTISPECIES: hypothetical protein [unclassified Nitratiruptor]|uniref:hypothetical protein n=1 Tax=unclassified Nitratiruptor TaxID=2624044 RepID=UPI00191584D5|nr:MULTISPECIES: hypothetical protein [unclassified Nitratiruptor]BCD59881.1 hypothetical protein NitYY0810_C0640 [Nitratiruptor sp. YY08-10]BCD63804.1 hypothetical protein NitYY0814_C0639 [Nitratiruptor sp. YY08-14]